jgi:hypothetical protein
LNQEDISFYISSFHFLPDHLEVRAHNMECSNHDMILNLFRLIPNDWVCFHAYA